MTQYYNDPNSLKKHGKSFYWASFFLPKRNKDAATKLYSICRFFDDLADDNNEDQTKILTGEFKKICDDLSHPINEFFTSNNLSIKILGDLVDGLVKDQTDVRIKNEKELIINYIEKYNIYRYEEISGLHDILHPNKFFKDLIVEIFKNIDNHCCGILNNGIAYCFSCYICFSSS